MITRPRVALTLLAALFLLAVPAVASAAVYEVDSTGDEPDASVGVAGCLTAGLKCSLRAALEESNASTGVKDTILFKASEFQGQLTDTIEPATVLPSITAPVEINGGTCLTAAGVNGPCAGVNGPTGEVGFNVTADETSIYDLAITGLSFGINVASASTGFTAGGNWIGVKLDGTAGANSNFGIFVDPNSDGATIGGTEVVQRNVIANTTGTGLDLEGASEATIQGNYFGVGVDGETTMANGKNIEITGRAGFIPSEDVEAEQRDRRHGRGPRRCLRRRLQRDLRCARYRDRPQRQRAAEREARQRADPRARQLRRSRRRGDVNRRQRGDRRLGR